MSETAAPERGAAVKMKTPRGANRRAERAAYTDAPAFADWSAARVSALRPYSKRKRPPVICSRGGPVHVPNGRKQTMTLSDRRRDANRTDNSLMAAALDHARRGIPVFPCHPADKGPLTRNGFKDASTDERQIRTWWQ